jgi:ribonuclease HII
MRDKLNPRVKNKTLKFYLAERSNQFIDKMGVAFALRDAYVEVFHNLYQPDCLIISDGILKFDNPSVETYDRVSLIKADAQIPAVMAASILAKTYRDDLMHEQHKHYHQYGWDTNVGYGSKEHLNAIWKHGVTPLHRMSYAPMSDPNFEADREALNEIDIAIEGVK